MGWTPDQLKAIELHGKNLLVSAAAEMRSRIHSTLAQRMLDAHDDEYLDRLERQSILLSGASIMTVHAFCQMLLRRHFSKIDLDPKFRTADEHELNIFMQELIEDVFESRYADDDLERRVDPEGWLRALPTAFDLPSDADIKDVRWYDKAAQQIVFELGHELSIAFIVVCVIVIAVLFFRRKER